MEARPPSCVQARAMLSTIRPIFVLVCSLSLRKREVLGLIWLAQIESSSLTRRGTRHMMFKASFVFIGKSDAFLNISNILVLSFSLLKVRSNQAMLCLPIFSARHHGREDLRSPGTRLLSRISKYI